MYRTLKFALSSAFLAVPTIAFGQAKQPANVVDVTPSNNPPIVATPVGGNAADAPVASAPGKSTVLLLPINAPSGSYNWVGRAIQQDVEVDLSQMGIARVIAPASGPQADDSQAALKAARDAGASHVVFATAQVSGSQIRVTGQVLDASDGKSLGAIKMTAPADNLFPLEDGLSAQIAHALPGGPEALASAAKAQNQQVPADQPKQSMPTVIYGQPASTDTVTQAPQYSSSDSTPYTTNTYVYTQPYDYDYSYGYPYYGYGFYPGIYFGGFGFYGGHYHNYYRGGGGFRGGFGGGGFHGSGGFHGGGHAGGGHR